MKDSMKMTAADQFIRVLLTHLGAAAVSLVFQMVAFWYFIGRSGFKEVIGVAFTLVYAGMMYNTVNKLAVRDYKEYTPLKPSMIKGILMGVFISFITLLVYLAWKYIWINCVDDTGIVGFGAHICNLIFIFWTFPFYGLMGASEGHITILGHILMYTVPVIASTAGYAAAKYGIDLLDLFQRSVYEKPEDQDDEDS